MTYRLTYILAFTLICCSTNILRAQESIKPFVKIGLEEEFSSKVHRLTTPLALATSIGALTVTPAFLMVSIFLPFVEATLTDHMAKDIGIKKALRYVREKYIEQLSPDSPYYASFQDGKVYFDNIDWWLEFSKDTLVIEVKSKPMSHDFFIQHRTFIQDIIYKSMNKAFYTPRKLFGMGHINIGGEWIKDAKTVRNFLIDLANHTELYNGVLYYDNYRNYGAKPSSLSIKSRESIKRFLEITKDYTDANEILKTYTDYVGAFSKRDSHMRIRRNRDGEYLIEYRGARTKKGAKELGLYLKLFESRIKYLSNIDQEIEYHAAGAITSYQQGIDQFYLYTQQAGLDWGVYKTILPHIWRFRKPSEDIKELSKRKNSHSFEKNYKHKIFKYNSKNQMPFWMNCSVYFFNR